MLFECKCKWSFFIDPKMLSYQKREFETDLPQKEIITFKLK